jgi:hypothetical protein
MSNNPPNCIKVDEFSINGRCVTKFKTAAGRLFITTPQTGYDIYISLPIYIELASRANLPLVKLLSGKEGQEDENNPIVIPPNSEMTKDDLKKLYFESPDRTVNEALEALGLQ